MLCISTLSTVSNLETLIDPEQVLKLHFANPPEYEWFQDDIVFSIKKIPAKIRFHSLNPTRGTRMYIIYPAPARVYQIPAQSDQWAYMHPTISIKPAGILPTISIKPAGTSVHLNQTCGYIRPSQSNLRVHPTISIKPSGILPTISIKPAGTSDHLNQTCGYIRPSQSNLRVHPTISIKPAGTSDHLNQTCGYIRPSQSNLRVHPTISIKPSGTSDHLNQTCGYIRSSQSNLRARVVFKPMTDDASVRQDSLKHRLSYRAPGFERS